jgi:hypothetical protein
MRRRSGPPPSQLLQLVLAATAVLQVQLAAAAGQPWDGQQFNYQLSETFVYPTHVIPVSRERIGSATHSTPPRHPRSRTRAPALIQHRV